MAKMEKAAVMEMYFKALPDVVKAASAPLVKDIMYKVTKVTDVIK